MKKIILHEIQFHRLLNQIVENVIREFYAKRRKEVVDDNNGYLRQIAENFCMLAYIQQAGLICTTVNHWKNELCTAMNNMVSPVLKNNSVQNRKSVFAPQMQRFIESTEFSKTVDRKFDDEFKHGVLYKKDFIDSSKSMFISFAEHIINEIIEYKGKDAVTMFINSIFPHESFALYNTKRNGKK